MNKDRVSLPADKIALFARLADVLEQASGLLWEISQGESNPMVSQMVAIDELLETDPALADTMALMLNHEAQTSIAKSLSEAQAGKTRPAREFFNEL
jgi:hypothetical protein